MARMFGARILPALLLPAMMTAPAIAQTVPAAMGVDVDF
jgi:hypothetical protein